MSKNQIFNKSSLESLSSPDQIDRLVKVTPLPFWLFICGGAFIVVVAFIWSLVGYVSYTENAMGVYLPQGQSYSLTTVQAGIVDTVYVQNGDKIQEGDAIFSIDTKSAEDALDDLCERRATLEGITISSSGDVANEDTVDLINIKIQMGNVGIEVNQISETIKEYKKNLRETESELKYAEKKLLSAQETYDDVYEKYTKGDATQLELTVAQRKLTEAQNNYNSLYSELKTLKQQISSATVQNKSATVELDNQKNSLVKQFNATKKGKLDALDKAIESQEKTVEDGKVRTTMSGSILNLNVAPGAAIGQGEEYMTVRQISANDEDIIQCYISIQTGKSIKPGMKVIVYPTNVNRQEYGHMEATVVFVDDYVTTQLELKQALGNDSLVAAFSQQGPLIGIKCQLKEDSETVSGYYWSSKKGAQLTLTEGTLVSADVVVEESHPISKLIPYIKDKAYDFVTPKDNAFN